MEVACATDAVYFFIFVCCGAGSSHKIRHQEGIVACLVAASVEWLGRVTTLSVLLILILYKVAVGLRLSILHRVITLARVLIATCLLLFTVAGFPITMVRAGHWTFYWAWAFCRPSGISNDSISGRDAIMCLQAWLCHGLGMCIFLARVRGAKIASRSASRLSCACDRVVLCSLTWCAWGLLATVLAVRLGHHVDLAREGLTLVLLSHSLRSILLDTSMMLIIGNTASSLNLLLLLLCKCKVRLRLTFCCCWVLLALIVVLILLMLNGSNIGLRNLIRWLLALSLLVWDSLAFKLLKILPCTVRDVYIRWVALCLLYQLNDVLCVMKLGVVSCRVSDYNLFFLTSVHWVTLTWASICC